MNETYAQRVMTHAMWSGVSVERMTRGLALSLGLFVISAGVAGLWIGAFGRAAACSSANGWRWFGRCVAVLVAAIIFVPHDQFPVSMELPLHLEIVGNRYFALLLLGAAGGWMFGGFRIRTDLLLGAGAAAVLVGLRGDVWDYYLLDVGVLGVFAVEPVPVPDAEVPGWRRLAGTVSGIALVAFMAMEHRSSALGVKRVLDGSRALTVLSEHALRAGRIGPDALSITPFGFQGWHLFPHFTRTLGADGRYIADFTRFLRPGALVVESRGMQPGTAESVNVPVDGRVVAVGVFGAMWTERHEFTLRLADQPAVAETPIAEAGYECVAYPLTDGEWRAVIAGPGLDR